MKILAAMMLLFAGSVHANTAIEIREMAEYEIRATTTLANLTVGQDMKRYSVRVRDCANNISHVMLRVAEAGIRVQGAGVSYTNGENDQYNFTYSFAAGYDSPWIGIDSFKKPGKCIASVFVNAQSTDPQIKSRVTVFGNTH